MASRWLAPSRASHPFQIHTDTTDFFRVEYGDVVVLKGRPYLVRHNAKEGRFGIDFDFNYRHRENILIAVDESNNARRAVSYVGQLLGGSVGFKASILHVIPEPEEDYFPASTEKEKWFTQYEKKIDLLMIRMDRIQTEGNYENRSFIDWTDSRRCRGGALWKMPLFSDCQPGYPGI